MRLLLIAYEFLPSASPQSLRWAYLIGRLADRGHECHVLAPDLLARTHGLPPLPESVRVHRVYPGPVRGTLDRLSLRKPQAQPQAVTAAPGWTVAAGPATLNWKGRLVERAQHVIGRAVFPDLRGEWLRPATAALPALLERLAPDVVISSHEPATSLQLGLQAQRLGYRWIADLGDPVLASYTEARWRRRAGRLERSTMQRAEHVVVTTEETRRLLAERNAVPLERISVIPQGYDEQFQQGVGMAPSGCFDPGLTELLYAGSFYSFRRPDALLDAVARTPGVRLNIASANVPIEVLAAAQACPGRVRVLGYLPHRALLQLQKEANMLVNIANQDPSQIPGKLYEYFGSGTPVLHLQAQAEDATGDLLRQLRRGWSCRNEPDAISNILASIHGLRLSGEMDGHVDLGQKSVAGYSWTSAAVAFDHLIVGDRVSPAGACA